MPNSIRRWNGSTWTTVYPDAVDTNTAGTIVLRGAGGNFSAGTITATLNGSAPAGSLSGTTLASGVTASSLTSVGTLSTLTVSGNVTFDGTSIRFPTNLVDVTLGANPTSGDRLRLHRSGANSYIDFSGALHFRSGGDSEDLVVQSNGVTKIDKPSHTYCGMTDQSTIQSIPNQAFRPINFQSAGVDYANMHNTSTTNGADGYPLNTRVVVPVAGFWQFWAQVPLVDSVNGRRILEIRRYNSGGTLQNYWRHSQDAGDQGTDMCLSLTGSFECAANDYIQVWYWHNSGAARNTVSGFGVASQVGWTLLRATP